MPTNAGDKDYTADEVARRRDAVIRRMANTPPQPRVKPKSHRRGKKKPAASDRAARKSAGRDKES